MARPRSPTTDFAEKDGAIMFLITRGLVVTIDAGDADILRHRWHAHPKGSNIYAATQINGKRVMLHRFIAKPPPGMIVDHFNGNTLDDRRWNLRICSLQDNAVNTARREDAGISWDAARQMWFASIKWRGERFFVGRFGDRTEAVIATQIRRQRLMDEDAHFQGETGATDHTLLEMIRRVA